MIKSHLKVLIILSIVNIILAIMNVWFNKINIFFVPVFIIQFIGLILIWRDSDRKFKEAEKIFQQQEHDRAAKE